MKKFLLLTLCFIGIAIGVSLSLVILVRMGVQNQSYALDSQRNILVIGHSTGEFSINPKVANRMLNCCQAGESFLRSYGKLEYILRDNPQIDTVILMLSPTTLTPWADYDFHYRGFAKQQNALFYPLFRWPEIKTIITERILSTQIPIKEMGNALMKGYGYVELLGGFSPKTGTRLPEDINYYRTPSPEKQEYETEKNKYCNTLQNKYLNKIALLCAERKIKLFLLEPPIYKARQFFDLDSIRLMWKRSAGQIEILDYTELPLADSCFFDVMHLNAIGADQFSLFLHQNGLKNANKEERLLN